MISPGHVDLIGLHMERLTLSNTKTLTALLQPRFTLIVVAISQQRTLPASLVIGALVARVTRLTTVM